MTRNEAGTAAPCLPAGFPVELGPRARQYDDGRVLVGGSRPRLDRLAACAVPLMKHRGSALLAEDDLAHGAGPRTGPSGGKPTGCPLPETCGRGR